MFTLLMVFGYSIESQAQGSENWRAVYYPTVNFKGAKVSCTVNSINFSWGSKSPAKKIPSSKFSATFEKKMTVSKTTTYVLMGKADDGLRIYVDGKRKVNEWKAGERNFEKQVKLTKGNHTIRVEYYNIGKNAKLKVNIKEAASVTPLEKWGATFYSKQNLTGKAVKKQFSALDANWGTGSPDPSIPANQFSAVFEKRTNITKSGTYLLSGGADDGIRIYVDGVKKVDQWKDNVQTFNVEIALSAGIHIIKVEYYEKKATAQLTVKLDKKAKKEQVTYTNYGITLNEALAAQMKVNPQTDKKYSAYIPAVSVKLDSKNINSGAMLEKTVIKAGTSTVSRTLATLPKKTKVKILGFKVSDDKELWYKVQTGWVNASSADTKHYLNPEQVKKGTPDFYQFVKLSDFAGLNPAEINQKILFERGILKNRADAFIKAGFKYGINEIYLLAHSSLETGKGTSRLSKGIKVKAKLDSKGKPVYTTVNIKGKQVVEKEIDILPDDAKNYEKKVYNMYGIGAYDTCALECGARRAFNEGWTSVDKAIIEGARYAAEDYIHEGQDTIYKMRWNPDYMDANRRAYHQYASDIGWAAKQTKYYIELYKLLDSYTITYDVPRYKK
ncbi:PA14 domain-containing protein [Peribacillus sp. FSL H8-0477]|uniref:PA14 domain-containing protein n=1 Tax=Peribacillus sp. FSL H8-0477 TaxID=2921388 RepID=UPI0030FC704F